MAQDGFKIILDELNAMIHADKVMRIAVSSVLAEQKKRIYQNGLASNGSKIGTYSTKPASISRKNQAGSTGKTYFKGGYAEYKSLVNRNPGFVILRNTDQMMLDHGMFVLVPGSEYGIGFNNEFNFDKSEWVENHFNKDIFDATDSEDELLERVFFDELDKILG